MSVPANFKTAISSREFRLCRWLEIEGIPRCYGTFEASGAFFSARDDEDQFDEIKPFLKKIPRSLEQQIDTLEGGALTVGQTEFEIVDADAIPTEWAGVGYTQGRIFLDAEINEAATTIPFIGDASDFPTADGFLYIGTETIFYDTKAAGQFEGCVRGMYRSTPQDFGKGFPIGTRPYTMANRRCWYHEVAIQGRDVTVIADADPDRAIRYVGIARNFRLGDNDHGSFLLTIETMERELDRPIFVGLRQFALKGQSIMNKDGDDGTVTIRGYPGFNDDNANNILYNFSGPEMAKGPPGFFARIDDEIVAINVEDSSGPYPSASLVARALMGTKAASHSDGATVQEIAVICAAGNGTFEQENSYFDSLVGADHDISNDHPLAILLTVLTSTGTATNYGGTGFRNYDTLPAGWGLGIDFSRIDVEGIEAAAAEEPNLHFGGFVDQPLNFAAFCREILKMAGYYFVVTIGDKFTIKRLRPPLPDAVVTSIGNDNRIRKFYTKWEANWSGAIRQIIFKFGWDFVAGKYRRVTIFNINDAEVFSKGLARTVTLESKYLFPGAGGIPGEPKQAVKFDVDTWLLARRDFYRTRYGRPPPIIRERVDYSYLDSEVGDIVTVTHSSLPNTVTGTRGFVNGVGEIIGKAIDEVSNTIEFTILMTGWSLGDYRYISPSMEIIDDEGDVFSATVEPNKYTKAVGPKGNNQLDWEMEDGNGVLFEAFPVDSDGSTLGEFPFWIWKKDFTAKNGMRITDRFFSAGAWHITMVQDVALEDDYINEPGAVITFRNSDALYTTTRTDLFAYMGDTSDNLLVGMSLDENQVPQIEDPAIEVDGHKYFPI